MSRMVERHGDHDSGFGDCKSGSNFRRLPAVDGTAWCIPSADFGRRAEILRDVIRERPVEGDGFERKSQSGHAGVLRLPESLEPKRNVATDILKAPIISREENYSSSHSTELFLLS